MPSDEERERLNTTFRHWWPGVENEGAIIDNAWQVMEFIRGKTLDTIKAELTNADSPSFRELDKPHGKRTFGVILSSAFAISEYIEKASSLSDDERETLTILLDNLKGFYRAPRADSKQKTSQIASTATKWLDKQMLSAPQPGLAKALCASIYTLGKLMSISLLGLSSFHKRLAGPDNIERLTKAFQSVLPLAEKKMALLDKKSTAPVEFKPTTIRGQFDSQLIYILNTVGIDLPSCLIMAQEKIEEINGYLSALIVAKEKYATLSIELAASKAPAERMLTAIKKNNELVIGRLYTGALIERMRDDFDKLLEKMSPEDQQAWRARVQELNTNTKTDVGLSILSWGFAVPNIAARLGAQLVERVTPSAIQKIAGSVGSSLPSVATPDSKCKEALSGIAYSHIAQLDLELRTVGEEIEQLTSRLVDDNDPVSEQISRAKPEELRQILSRNGDISKEIARYGQFITQISNNQEVFEAIGQYESSSKYFIKKHRTLSVILNQALSAFVQIFSSTLAQQVKSSKTTAFESGLINLSSGLDETRQQYSTGLSSIMHEINQDPDISHETRVVLMEQLTSKLASSPPSLVQPSAIQNKFRQALQKIMSQEARPIVEESEAQTPTNNVPR